MEQITQILQTFSSWATAITAITLALSAVFKPVRNCVKWIFGKFYNNGNSEIIAEIKNVETNFNNRMDAMNNRIDDMNQRITAVSSKNDENERDRLRHVIFQYGNYARKQQRISGEEYRYVQESFEKYTALGGNHGMHTEMAFITDYYNHQNWG